MGEIYVALDLDLGRTVAIKVLAEGLAEDAAVRARFRREALTAARLSGELHVVTIYDVGEGGGRPFIVMEYLPGGTLADRALGLPVEPDAALEWLGEAASALDAAHARGVVHRDVKPSNLLFDAAGRLQVVDFGIARLVDETVGITAPGTVLGTAGYLAPEQALGQATSPASDRYALGVVAYELLAGSRPFERGSEAAEAAAHVHGPVPPVSERRPGLPTALDVVFERALAKNPAHRYPTAKGLVAALARANHPEQRPPTAPTRLMVGSRSSGARTAPVAVAAALLLLGIGIAAALLAVGNDPEPAPGAGAGREPVTREVTVAGRGTTVVTTVPGPPAGRDSLVPATAAAALNDQAFELMHAGRWEEALPLLERAVPALAGTYTSDFRAEAYAEYNLGRTLAELGRCPEAVPHLERSKKLQGNREPIRAALDVCGRGKGKKEKKPKPAGPAGP
jgi:serine/threonine-protein kinase